MAGHLPDDASTVAPRVNGTPSAARRSPLPARHQLHSPHYFPPCASTGASRVNSTSSVARNAGRLTVRSTSLPSEQSEGFWGAATGEGGGRGQATGGQWGAGKAPGT